MVIVIKIKGLPWEATGREIRDFFRGLLVEDIRLAPNKDGKASGIAFACFNNDDDARKAMLRNGKYIGKRYMELFLSSRSEMDKVLKEGVPESRGARFESDYTGQAIGQGNEMRSARERRSPVRRFERGRGNGPNSRRVQPSPDERGVKRGFEREMEPSENRRGRPSHRPRTPPNERHNMKGDIRERPLKMFRSRSPKDKFRERSRVEQRESRHRDNRRDSVEDLVDLSRATCVHVLGLPFDARERDLQDFFSGLNIRDILIVKNSKGNHAGKPKGEAYVEFESVGDCVHAGERHMRFIGKRYIEVRRVEREVMQEALNINDEINQRRSSQRRGNLREDRGGSNIMSNAMPRDSGPGTMSAAWMDTINQRYGGVNEALANFMSSSASVAASANISISDVASGCVVGLRNLPSSISVDEILDFFYGFDAIPDTVRIHYLTPGRSSGDAMVTFTSNSEAKRAIEQLNFKPVGKRKIELFFV